MTAGGQKIFIDIFKNMLGNLLATVLIIVIFIALKNTTAKIAITSTPTDMTQILVESNNYIDYSDVNLVNLQNNGLSVFFLQQLLDVIPVQILRMKLSLG
ncbi:hypothetical protein COV58_01710 [Candidatus Roizmanbacteria bacterium CG11_big_fil_rev_8_21_14_0_20_36_8]|uniref:Uncharacterized protein n=1 Tax=Candidatus Roizmanbacteria bacterium CG11_big_fil_rev_8_21_14_0_20_36_8 TaxID=1974856 RepID=A0A2M6IUR0_9BACT|nr:MAG: hypothetical protein COV58_01710 [Candidatus Roizmanbacteria bacterium CG11_big_fil_rev_8_21_14_0_20_36_8]